jgi:hypothetical protein
MPGHIVEISHSPRFEESVDGPLDFRQDASRRHKAIYRNDWQVSDGLDLSIT